MKKSILVLMIIVAATTTKAQFDATRLYASVSGNYTMYKGDFKQKTPGVKLDFGYSFSENVRGALGYTYHLPIKVSSSIVAGNGTNTTSIPAEIVYNFSTISLLGNYSFGEGEDNTISFYAPVGIGYVIAKYREDLKGTLPNDYVIQDQLVPGKESGFIINLGLGGQYNMGSVRLFTDANLALPANKVGTSYVTNAIPTHFVFNVGVRIPFGSSGE